ncbi:hypothetical protein QDW22_gp15 [Microbacterium Phage DirtyBubble]|uniref:hypothetical protein n=1 Tax=Microbacterium Phage DirtyBubble TaxID=2590932 RepID=UPI00118AA410|nr:hypothetical protein QDW22_gp15 [Microbacterium Phage DirtyBubble]QDP45033.1 hypothetical protein DIRTYBUBBLE_15 [Microbacterium Phage DirtyBubble]
MNSNEKLIANSQVLDGVARVTVVGTNATVVEAREAARAEGRRLLGTEDVRVENHGWHDSGIAQHAFYQVHAN